AGVERVAALRVLQPRRHRRKNGHDRNTQPSGLAGGVDECRNWQPEHFRHRGDRFLMPLVVDKDRPDQIARGKDGLGDELARPRIAAVAPQARLWIGGERREERSHWISPEKREQKWEIPPKNPRGA